MGFSDHVFQWFFLRAAVTFPIVGVDFLIASHLLMEVADNRLVDTATGNTLRLTRQPSGPTASVVLLAETRVAPQRPASPKWVKLAGTAESGAAPSPPRGVHNGTAAALHERHPG